MAQAAARSPGVFIAAGLPVDFLSRLEAATVAMLQSVDEGSKNRGRMRGATEGLSTRLREARLAVSILDALVRVALADDPALLTNWNRIKSVQRSRVRTAWADTPSAWTPVAAAA